MASPQVENGYAPIANQLLDELLKLGLTGTQWQIVLWVVRHTYGWKRKVAAFSWYKMAHILAMDRGGITKEGKKLIAAGILRVQNGSIGVQKDFERWDKEKLDGSRKKAIRTADPEPGKDAESVDSSPPWSGVHVEPAPLKAWSPLHETVVPAPRHSGAESTLFRRAKSILKSKEINKTTTGENRTTDPGPYPPSTPSSPAKPETPLQQVMNHYIAFKRQTLDKAQTTAFYNRFGKAAKSLLEACSGNVSTAISAINRIGDHLNKKGLSWTLDTIFKWHCDPSLMQGGEIKNGTHHCAGEASPIPGKYDKFSAV